MISKSKKEQIRKLSDHFLHKYYDYLGTLYDCVFGLNKLVQNAEEMLNVRKEDVINEDYEKMHEYARVFSFQEEVNNFDTIHYVTSGPDICRRIITKQNETFLSKMFIVHIFELWEHFYRVKIAEVLTVPDNEIKIPILGDLCKLRNAIIHNNGYATKEVNRCEIIKHFKYKDQIIITSKILWEIKLELEKAFEIFNLDLK
jgi:hypothetical protein